MLHDKETFPDWTNATREEISRLFAPRSPYCLMSVAKLSRLFGYALGNGGPVLASRNRRTLPPKKRSGRNLHGRGCSACHPRHGRPWKPYDRAGAARLSRRDQQTEADLDV